MMRTWKNKWLPAVLTGLALVLGLSPFHLFPVCTELMANGRHMSCYYSAWLIVGIAVAIGIISLATIRWNNKIGKNISYLIILGLAILGYALPKRMIAVGHMKLQGWQIGLCMSPDMACQRTTMPAVTILLLVIGLLAIEGLVLNFLVEDKNPQTNSVKE